MLKHYEREKIIWESELPGNEKFLLLAINSFVDSNGECWPGQELLARMCGIGDRTIRNLCKSLEVRGIVERIRRFDTHGFRTSDKFKVNFDAVKNPPESPPKSLPAKSATGKICHRKMTTVLPENDDSPTGNLRQNLPANISRDLSSKNYPEELSNELDPPVVPQGEDGANRTTDEPEITTADSNQQLGILEPEQPAIPDQQNEEARNSGEHQEGKGSAPSGTKNKRQRERKEKPKEPELTDAQIEQLGELYNEYRPERWANFRPGISKDRQRLSGYLFKFANWNFERAKVILSEALMWARLDPFWSGVREGKRGRFKNGSFRFVLEDSRFESWSESFSSTGLDLAAIHSSDLSDAALQEAQGQYQKRQQQQEDPAMAKLRAMGLVA
ncbi:MAG: helix-turn-helix domain-containing protein [Cyanobacteria bacterium P01_F01_bin.13]